MEVKLTKENPIEFLMQVRVSWDEVKERYEKILSIVQKKAKVRGFRPGKVPRRFVEEFYGPIIKTQLIEDLMESSLKKVEEENSGLIIYNIFNSEVSPIEEGKDFNFNLKLEVNPQLEPERIVYKGLEVKRFIPRPLDSLLEESLNSLRERYATLKPKEENGTVELGDIVNVRFSVFVGDKQYKNETDIVVGQSGIMGILDKEPEKIKEGLLGRRKGDKVEIVGEGVNSQRVPEGIRGKEVRYELEILNIRVKEYPELNDEFVKNLGDSNIKNMEELKNRLREEIERRIKVEEKEFYKKQLIEQLLSRNEFPIPKTPLNEYMKKLEDSLPEQLKNYIKTELGEEKYKEDIRFRAERELKLSYILNYIAKLENIEVVDTDLEGFVLELAEKNNEPYPKYKAIYLNNPQKRKEIEAIIKEEKIWELIRKYAKVVEESLQEEKKEEALQENTNTSSLEGGKKSRGKARLQKKKETDSSAVDNTTSSGEKKRKSRSKGGEDER